MVDDQYRYDWLGLLTPDELERMREEDDLSQEDCAAIDREFVRRDRERIEARGPLTVVRGKGKDKK